VSQLRHFVRRHRFSTFVALTFVLTWLPWLTVAWILRTGRQPVVTTLVLIGGFGPFLAAVLVAAAVGDLWSWLGNLVDIGAPLGVWTAAVLVPIALYGLALGAFLLVGGGLAYYALRSKLALLEDGVRVNWKWWGNSEIKYADIEEVMFKTVGGAGKIGVIIKTPVQQIKLAGMQDQFPLGREIARRAIPHGATVTGNPSGVAGGEPMDLTPRSFGAYDAV